MAKRFVIFDIETYPFSLAFQDARSTEERQHNAPRMRLACAFDGQIYSFYQENNISELITLLRHANEVVSFNSKNFDELVLRRHYNLTGKLPLSGDHIDLLEIVARDCGRRISLDKLSTLNLGERKHTDGRSMSSLTIEELKVACQSDVSQTYRLWNLHNAKQLKIPPKNFNDDSGDAYPGHHMPDICPNCHDGNSLIMLEHDIDEMSEAQESDYLAGMYGDAYCQTCKYEFAWGY